MGKEKKQQYTSPSLQILGKLRHATHGGNSSCNDGPQSSQQCSSGNN